MADPKDSKAHENEVVRKAINDIAATKSGRIFFRWLIRRCFLDRSTIVGNPETYEVNSLGSIAQAFLQRLGFDIFRAMRSELRQKIEYPDQEETP